VTLKAPQGTIELDWNYGPQAFGQMITGDLHVKKSAVPKVPSMLDSLSVLGGAAYAYADARHLVFADSRVVFKKKRTLLPSHSFYAVYWHNYFGEIFAREMCSSLQEGVFRYRVLPSGGVSLQVQEFPPSDDDVCARIAGYWPVFEKYNPNAKFIPPIDIDYSEVRSLAGMVAEEGKSVGTVVGDPNDFLRRIPELRSVFVTWAKSKGLIPGNESEFLEFVHRHRGEIEASPRLLTACVAGYGELIRASQTGYWSMGRLFARGEPVVAFRGRPWASRRVVLEVIEALDLELD